MSEEFHARGAARRKIKNIVDYISLHYAIDRETAREIVKEGFLQSNQGGNQ